MITIILLLVLQYSIVAWLAITRPKWVPELDTNIMFMSMPLIGPASILGAVSLLACVFGPILILGLIGEAVIKLGKYIGGHK